jgi:hypothetical protein
MTYKTRIKPVELMILRILYTRMDLTGDEQKYYSNLEKGFEGEVQFDLLTEELQSECLIINDLLLEDTNSKFQIDSSIIFQETIYTFEVKNYEGDFRYQSVRFETISGKEIKNPLDPLKQSKSLFRQLLKIVDLIYQLRNTLFLLTPSLLISGSPKRANYFSNTAKSANEKIKYATVKTN